MDVKPFAFLYEINNSSVDSEGYFMKSSEDVVEIDSDSDSSESFEKEHVGEEVGKMSYETQYNGRNKHSSIVVKTEKIVGDRASTSQNNYRFKTETSEAEDSNSTATETKTKIHPYSYIIDTFEYPPDQLKVTADFAVKPLEQKVCHVVYSRNSLKLSLAELRNAREIALDIHHGEGDSETNIALLMISTTEKDYLIDAKKLSAELVMLTEVFINPKVPKIVYNAHKVLKLLQQAMDLYVVNVFDLLGATQVLDSGSPVLSLSQLILNDFNFERGSLTNQDFGLRPITEEVRKFCRSGTHFLIPLYHNVKNEFIQRNFDAYKKFLKDCRDLTKVMNEENLVSQEFLNLENELKVRHECGMEVLKELYHWRNEVAEEKNVAVGKVLSKGSLLTLVRILPNDVKYIAKLVPSLHVKDSIERVRAIIIEAKIRHKLVSDRQAKAYFDGGTSRKRKAVEKQQEKSKKRKVNEKKSCRKENKKKRKKEAHFSDSGCVDPVSASSSYTYQKQEFGNDNLSSDQANFFQTTGNHRRKRDFSNNHQNHYFKNDKSESHSYQELSAIDQKINAFEKTIHKQPNRTTGRHIYFEDDRGCY